MKSKLNLACYLTFQIGVILTIIIRFVRTVFQIDIYQSIPFLQNIQYSVKNGAVFTRLLFLLIYIGVITFVVYGFCSHLKRASKNRIWGESDLMKKADISCSNISDCCCTCCHNLKNTQSENTPAENTTDDNKILENT